MEERVLREELIHQGVKEVDLIHGNRTVVKSIKSITNEELKQYKFDRIVGTVAQYTRLYISPVVI